MIKKFNISKPEKWTDKTGAEKTQWHQVGTLTEFENGNRIIEIPAIGLKANVFEQKEKSAKKDEEQPF